MATRSVNHSRFHLPPARAAFTNSVELERHLVELEYVAMNIGDRFLLASDPQHHLPALISVQEAVQQLKSAKFIADSLQFDLRIFACTDARIAASVTTDEDRRDRKFLSGIGTSEGFHVYCGGLDAAISRGLIFAPHADLVCFRSNKADLSEAARFAAAIKSKFPDKGLAFGYTPTRNGARWNEHDHRAFEEKLRKLGYEAYFVPQFGQTFFPCTHISGAWVLFNDAIRSKAALPAVGSSLGATSLSPMTVGLGA
jgi:isocitrate lyase